MVFAGVAFLIARTVRRVMVTKTNAPEWERAAAKPEPDEEGMAMSVPPHRRSGRIANAIIVANAQEKKSSFRCRKQTTQQNTHQTASNQYC